MVSRSFFQLAISLACLSLILGVGCSGKKTFKLVPAKGVVKIDGVPAANIMVQFMPDFLAKNDGPTSQAISDENGQFILNTVIDNQPGAVEGDHVVVLVDTEEERPAQGEEPTRPVRLSPKYTTAAGGLKVKIVEGQDIVLEATRD